MRRTAKPAASSLKSKQAGEETNKNDGSDEESDNEEVGPEESKQDLPSSADQELKDAMDLDWKPLEVIGIL